MINVTIVTPEILSIFAFLNFPFDAAFDDAKNISEESGHNTTNSNTLIALSGTPIAQLAKSIGNL